MCSIAHFGDKDAAYKTKRASIDETCGRTTLCADFLAQCGDINRQGRTHRSPLFVIGWGLELISPGRGRNQAAANVTTLPYFVDQQTGAEVSDRKAERLIMLPI